LERLIAIAGMRTLGMISARAIDVEQNGKANNQ
jgi:hypothetical protein